MHEQAGGSLGASNRTVRYSFASGSLLTGFSPASPGPCHILRLLLGKRHQSYDHTALIPLCGYADVTVPVSGSPRKDAPGKLLPVLVLVIGKKVDRLSLKIKLIVIILKLYLQAVSLIFCGKLFQ